jgi:hypothetical protein
MSILAGSRSALGSIGLYGVLSFNIAQTSTRIRVRHSPSARSVDVMRKSCDRASGLTVAGIGIGCSPQSPDPRRCEVSSSEISPTIRSRWSATRPVLIVVAASLAGAAWRAAKADPLTVLRVE